VRVRSITSKYPRTLDGIRLLVLDLNSTLTRMEEHKLKDRAKEYDKKGVDIFLKGKTMVPYNKSIPMYGCHQLAKALVVGLREMGVSAKIGRYYPGNESFVIFRFGKELYEVLPFSRKIRKVDSIKREFYKTSLGDKKISFKGIENYTYADFKQDRKKAKYSF
jgi:hypothetical protein